MPNYLFEADSSEDELTREEQSRSAEIIKNIDEMIGQMQLSLYGMQKKNDVDNIINNFNNIVKSQTNRIAHQQGDSMASFLATLFDKEKKSEWDLSNIDNFLNSEDNSVINFLSTAYQNRMLKYEDLEQISQQLIELREAILIMRDAIVSPDTTEGNISRSLIFDYDDAESKNDLTSVIESMESKYKLHNKIKNLIVPHTLTYGSYYVYVIPYSKVFSDFAKKTQDPTNGYSYLSDVRQYTESTISFESGSDGAEQIKGLASEFTSQFSEDEMISIMESSYHKISDKTINVSRKFQECVEEELGEYMENIFVCNDSRPLPFVLESQEALSELYKHMAPDENETNLFNEVAKVDDGSHDVKAKRKRNKKIEKSFESIGDCFIKLMSPKEMIPIKILNTTIGYYYIKEENMKHINTIMASATYYNKYDVSGKQKTLIDGLVDRIVAKFDKKFLLENAEMKELIANALLYYDLNKKSIKFQFIPAEYVVEFKINEDVNGEGTSVIEPSLFYAKLYLLLLLFKITSIVLYSNDTRVNYIRTSGLDKNISKKIQEIAREKQNHQVNIYDMMSYTGLLKKIGNGSEMYIPTGRSGERGFETEILQGQDVQLNTELMELLRTSYILGTGVPSAIINYLNEADFAKSIETANTRFAGRVMSCQLDFNESLTELYRKIAKYSKMIEEDDADSFTVMLNPPKIGNNLVKNDMISTFQAMSDFIIRAKFGDQWQSDPNTVEIVKKLTMKLVDEYLPSINIDKIEEWIEDILVELAKDKSDPANKNTDNIDMFGDEM